MFFFSLQNGLPDHLHTNGLDNTRTILFNTSKKVCNFLSFKKSLHLPPPTYLSPPLPPCSSPLHSPPPPPSPPFSPPSPSPPPPSLTPSLIPSPPPVGDVYSVQWVSIVTESAQDPLEHTAVS